MREDTANRQKRRRRTHSVAVVVYDGVTPFELGVACTIFGDDRWLPAGTPWYRMSVCAARPGLVDVDGGLKIHAPDGLEKIRRADTIVVLPTLRIDEVPVQVIAALQQAHARGRRILSLCTGAFVLARAGLLDGRRATTHWSECEDFSRQYPLVTVDPGVLFIDDGDILTSAGSAASIDLCLQVVRQDHGSEIATQLAREMVVPPQRDGGQAQFIDTPMPAVDDTNLFADTIAWMQQHLDEELTIEALASRSAMSPRTFARRFLAATGTTPYQWLVRQRVHLAQRLLETTDLSIDLVADRSGLGSADNLRKHFSRAIHTNPQAYRLAFKDRSAA